MAMWRDHGDVASMVMGRDQVRWRDHGDVACMVPRGMNDDVA